jgi:hypothetical protein
VTVAVSRETEIVRALGDSPGFPAVDFLGTIFLRVEGEVVAEAVDRIDALEGDFCGGLVLSLTGSGSGGAAFFGFVVVFVLITEVADIRLGLTAVGVTDLVAVVFTLTVETVDDTELRRGRGGSSAGNSDLGVLNVDDTSLR